jgi:hypothetical protein
MNELTVFDIQLKRFSANGMYSASSLLFTSSLTPAVLNGAVAGHTYPGWK